MHIVLFIVLYTNFIKKQQKLLWFYNIGHTTLVKADWLNTNCDYLYVTKQEATPSGCQLGTTKTEIRKECYGNVIEML
jgi:hypothetical protein